MYNNASDLYVTVLANVHCTGILLSPFVLLNAALASSQSQSMYGETASANPISDPQ